jgi:hypothetical protein
MVRGSSTGVTKRAGEEEADHHFRQVCDPPEIDPYCASPGGVVVVGWWLGLLSRGWGLVVVVVVGGKVAVVTSGNEVLGGGGVVVVVGTVTVDGIGDRSAGLGGTAGPVRVPPSAVVAIAPISDRPTVTVGIGCVAAGWEPRTSAITVVGGVGDTTACWGAPTDTWPVALKRSDGDDAEPVTM